MVFFLEGFLAQSGRVIYLPFFSFCVYISRIFCFIFCWLFSRLLVCPDREVVPKQLHD